MIPYSVADGALVIEGCPSPVRFPQPVEQVAEFDDILVVRLQWSNDNLRNVYAVDAKGAIVWRIEEPPLNPMGALYFGVGRVSDEVVCATSSMGVTFYLDVHSGKVLTTELTK